jgi:hypothetical protein
MAPKLPKLRPVVVDAITEMLISEQGMLRPPEKAAALLALIVELHKKDLPFPPREEVAGYIDASLSTVDAALSTRLDEGYITQRVETRRGNVQRRNSVVRERYYDPSPHLISIVDQAEQGNVKRR